MADPIKKLNTQAALNDERRQFAQLLAAGQTGVANITGQAITIGDIVYYIAPVPLQLMIADVAPVLDKAYVGALKVTLVCLPFTIEVPSGRPVQNFLPSGLKGAEMPREMLDVLKELTNTVARRVDMIKHVDSNEEALLREKREEGGASMLAIGPPRDDDGGNGGTPPPEGNIQ